MTEVEGLATHDDVRRRSVDGRLLVLVVGLVVGVVLLARGGAESETTAPTTTTSVPATTDPVDSIETAPAPPDDLGAPRPVDALRTVEPEFGLATSFVVVDPTTGATAWWWLEPDAEETTGLDVGALQRATIDRSGRWLAGRTVDDETGVQSVVVYADVGARIEIAEGASISRVVWDTTEPGVLWWAGRDPSLLERVDVRSAIPARSEMQLGRPLPHGPPVPEATAVVTERWKLVGSNGSAGGPTLTIVDLESGAEVTVRVPGLPGPEFELLDLAIRT